MATDTMELRTDRPANIYMVLEVSRRNRFILGITESKLELFD